MEVLRKYSASRVGVDCSTLEGVHDNALFYECTFDKLNGLTLRDCVLHSSKLITSRIKDALGFTVTLGCHSFRGVELSPLLFDLMLCLLYMTVGNNEKREKLLDVLGRDHAAGLLKALRRIE